MSLTRCTGCAEGMIPAAHAHCRSLMQAVHMNVHLPDEQAPSLLPQCPAIPCTTTALACMLLRVPNVPKKASVAACQGAQGAPAVICPECGAVHLASKELLACCAISGGMRAQRKQQHPLGLSPLLAHGQTYVPRELHWSHSIVCRTSR